MPTKTHLHIVSFDVPFPPNYGGVIDVFHKIRCLHREGVEITLHCFEYGRGHKVELDSLCKKVYYYKRKAGIWSFLSFRPYIVKTRDSEELLQNLLLDESPILFEGLHTCHLLNDSRLRNRFKIFRESNVEHEYYRHLAKAESSLFKKLFFLIESSKLKWYEKQVANSNLMLIVSEEDTRYFQKNYPSNKVIYLPSFHGQDELTSKAGVGNYALYHGNFMVAENTKAAYYLIDQIFSKTDFPLVLAGLNPPDDLKAHIEKYKNIRLVASPSDSEMNQLIEEAHLHCMFTFQATGLKLKLLNVLYRGRFVLCNEAMLFGTQLHKFCIIKNDTQEIVQEIERIRSIHFTENDLSIRKEILQSPFGNFTKTQKLVNYLHQKFDE